MSDASRLSDLNDDVERVNETIARLLNEKARLACEILPLMRTLGVQYDIAPEEATPNSSIIAIAREGHLGPEAMTHLFRQVSIQVRVTELKAAREAESTPAAV